MLLTPIHNEIRCDQGLNPGSHNWKPSAQRYPALVEYVPREVLACLVPVAAPQLDRDIITFSLGSKDSTDGPGPSQ